MPTHIAHVIPSTFITATWPFDFSPRDSAVAVLSPPSPPPPRRRSSLSARRSSPPGVRAAAAPPPFGDTRGSSLGGRVAGVFGGEPAFSFGISSITAEVPRCFFSLPLSDSAAPGGCGCCLLLTARRVFADAWLSRPLPGRGGANFRDLTWEVWQRALHLRLECDTN